MRRFLVTPLMYAAALSAYAQPDTILRLPEPPAQSAIGYNSVSRAMADLKYRPGVRIAVTKPDAWTIINERGDIQWSFTPSSHAANPAVVRRKLKVDPKGFVIIETVALCEAEKSPCDKLLEEFKELNEKIRLSIRGRNKN